MSIDKRIIQYEIWKECRNRCKFCCKPGTKILMADYTQKNIEEISPGECVMGMVESPYFNCKPSKVIEVVNRQYDGIIYDNFTDNHPILACRPSRKKYVAAKNSQSQVYPILPIIKTPQSNEYKVGYIVGCFVGDGSFKKYKLDEYKKTINGKKYDYKARIAYRTRFAVNDIDITKKLKNYLLCYTNDFIERPFKIGNNKTTMALFSNKQSTYDFLSNLVSVNLAKNNTEDYCKGFLAAIYDCEGSINKSIIRIAQNSGAVLDEIIRCVERLNFHYIYENYKKCKTIRIYSKDYFRFIETVCPGCIRKIYKRRTTSQKTKKGMLIKTNYSGLVYNLQTETENYIANGMVVHNCFLSKDTIHTPDYVKISGIQNAIKQITDDINNKRIDGVAIIGGDFWQGEITTEEIRIEFFKLMQLCFDYLKNGDISEVWLSATLTIGEQKDLYRAIDMYYNMIPDCEKENKRLWICTSYDTIGRFHSQKMLDNWEYHMKNITEKYPKVFKNSSFIITNDLVKKTLSGEFDFTDFEKKFDTKIYMKTPSHHLKNWTEGKIKFNEIVGDFFLQREPTIRFLQKLIETKPELLEKIMNNELRANVLVGHGNNNGFDIMVRNQEDKHKNICEFHTGGDERAVIQNCGHEKHYRCYIDSDKCFMCDLRKIFKIL